MSKKNKEKKKRKKELIIINYTFSYVRLKLTFKTTMHSVQTNQQFLQIF